MLKKLKALILVLNWQMYLSQIEKYICLDGQVWKKLKRSDIFHGDLSDSLPPLLFSYKATLGPNSTQPRSYLTFSKFNRSNLLIIFVLQKMFQFIIMWCSGGENRDQAFFQKNITLKIFRLCCQIHWIRVQLDFG